MAFKPFGSAISSTKPSDTDAPAKPASLGDPPDAADADEDGETINLSTEQVKAAGLDDLSEGDNFTVTITGTVTSSDPDTGITATITDASEGERNNGADEDGGSAETSGDEEGFQRPKGKISMSPKEANMGF